MNITQPAVDSHAHIFDRRRPFSSDAHYSPSGNQQGQASEFRDVLIAHGFTHGLLVQALPYGFDNRAMLDAIKESEGTFKGVALIKPDVTDRQLMELDERGVIGIRFNLMFYGNKELEEPGADRLLARIKEMGWFLQLHCEKDNVAHAAPLLKKSGIKLVFDHFGRPDPDAGVKQPGFQSILEFGRSGNAVIKLSGPFRASERPFPYREVDPFIAAAIDAFTLDNCVWGSDWPFVMKDTRMDYGPPLNCVARWLPDPADQRKLFWESPSRLFGFKAE